MRTFIDCHCDSGVRGTDVRAKHNARWEIKQLQEIIDHFGTEEGFDEYCECNCIQIMVGNAEHMAETYFSPETWEAIYTAITTIICHLIEVNELDESPYYDAMIERYSKELGTERGSFVN